jgi:hypothetical protein
LIEEDDQRKDCHQYHDHFDQYVRKTFTGPNNRKEQIQQERRDDIDAQHRHEILSFDLEIV